MKITFEEIYRRIQSLNREIDELNLLRRKVPDRRPYSADLQVAFDRVINDLLNHKLELEQLEVESPPVDLVESILTVDLATASRIQVDRQMPARPDEKDAQIMKFLREIPKTELHLHIEACISRQTLMGILDSHGKEYNPEEINQLYNFKNLQEFIKLFLFILDAIRKPEDFVLIFNNLRSYCEANNIRYAEVFYAPSKLIQNGLRFEDIARTLDSLSRDCRLSGGPDIRYLVDVSRTFGPENASQNLQRLLACKTSSHIGIGLGGAELMGPARDYRDVFAQARAEGLHTVAHSGEDDGPWSIWDTVRILKAERIGHGTSAIQDPDLLLYLKEKQIPVEICLTSNLFTGKYVRRAEDHPVRRYYDEGLICTVNTDDPEIFDVDLTTEFYNHYKHLNFTITELVDLIRMGVFSSFHPDPQSLWLQFKKEIDAKREEYAL